MELSATVITVNGSKYIREDSIKQEADSGPDDIRIVILQRGFVMVGKFRQDGSKCELHNASVVRIWGTKAGLGELAASGPLTNTKLDPCNGVVKFHELTIIATINCEARKWKL